jgi:rod shape-determining protein MreC
MLHYLRNTKIFALVLLLAVGTTMAVLHNRAAEAGNSFLPEDIARVVIKPFQSAVNSIGGVFHSMGKSLRSRSAFKRENARLRAEVMRLSMEAITLREEAAEAKRLRTALALKESSTEQLAAARIISWEPSEWFRTATINIGRSSGIKPGQAVITNRGLLGQVFESSPTSAQIRSMTDSKSGVGAMVQRSRAIGICVGEGIGELQMSYLAKDADIKVGDVIITSGQGGIVPKGLPIGRVTKVVTEGGGFMKSASVRPSVHLDQTEEVFVVLRQVE